MPSRKPSIPLEMKESAIESYYQSPVRAEVVRQPVTDVTGAVGGTHKSPDHPPLPPSRLAEMHSPGGDTELGRNWQSPKRVVSGRQRSTSICASLRCQQPQLPVAGWPVHPTPNFPSSSWRNSRITFLNPPKGKRSGASLRKGLSVLQKLQKEFNFRQKEFKSPIYRNYGTMLSQQQEMSL